MTRWKLAFLLTLVISAPCAAQSTIYFEGFETGAAGWTFDPPVGGCAWAVDATPPASFGGISCGGAGFFGPLPTVFAGANALNFNNGTDIDYGVATSTGNSATGPLITVTSLVGVTMTIQDFYEMDSCAKPNIHRRFVEWLDSAGVVLKSVQLTYADGVDSEESCAPAPFPPVVAAIPGNLNDHHMHTFDISTLGTLTFRLRFRVELDAVGGLETSLVGWFVDNINIICPVADAAAPTLPTQIFPPSGATVISPVFFDWSDSTDTGPCGPGTLTYDLQIDDLATVLFPDFSFVGLGASTSIQPLAAGSYEWRVRAVDSAANASAFTALSPFIVEVNLPPGLPGELHVNEGYDGAQSSEPGFVDPVADETPSFSAIYNDPNVTPDFAIGLRFQVSIDPTFATLDFDSGPVGISPPLPAGTRCPDLTINVNLLRDTVYFWRIQFTDAGGLTSLFSFAQSFRIGDDFEFGVRGGSTHHGRRCWVATAAWSNENAPTVVALQSWRVGTLEKAAAGSVASRSYHVIGAKAAGAVESSRLMRTASSGFTGLGAGLAALTALGLVLLGLVRFVRPS